MSLDQQGSNYLPSWHLYDWCWEWWPILCCLRYWY